MIDKREKKANNDLISRYQDTKQRSNDHDDNGNKNGKKKIGVR